MHRQNSTFLNYENQIPYLTRSYNPQTLTLYQSKHLFLGKCWQIPMFCNKKICHIYPQREKGTEKEKPGNTWQKFLYKWRGQCQKNKKKIPPQKLYRKNGWRYIDKSHICPNFRLHGQAYRNSQTISYCGSLSLQCSVLNYDPAKPLFSRPIFFLKMAWTRLGLQWDVNLQGNVQESL